MAIKTDHIAVLRGGFSSEKDISLQSAASVIQALESLGRRVTPIDVDEHLIERIKEAKPDKIFNALHGIFGEDGTVQGILEYLGIPYTHSNVLASALAMDKKKTIDVLRENTKIRAPEGKVISTAELQKGDPLPKPYVVKPVAEGSSVGVAIIEEGGQCEISDYHPDIPLLIERYISGKELSVAVCDERPFGVIELQPVSGFYDYQHKYQENQTKHIMPAQIGKPVYEQAMDWAHQAHHVLGCSGISRSDFRYDTEKGELYFLELNTQPGMTKLSLVPEIAAYAGMSFEELIAYILDKVICPRD